MPKTVVKKAVLPIGGLGTRFLPLSKVFPKELWPLIDRPVIDYIVKEAKDSGAKEIIFVISPEKKIILDYFKTRPEIGKVLKKRGKVKLLKSLKSWQDIKFSYVVQKEPLGDGHAILQAKKKTKKEPVMVSFGDDLVVSRIPCLLQLARVFQKYRQPVIALKRLPKKKISSYGVVKAKKVGPRLYQIKGIVEKPKTKNAPSNLAVVGKYILTDEVFEYLEKARPEFRGEIILAQTLEKMIKDGKIIYGYEFEGEWLECGNVEKWLKSNIFLARQKVF